MDMSPTYVEDELNIPDPPTTTTTTTQTLSPLTLDDIIDEVEIIDSTSRIWINHGPPYITAHKRKLVEEFTMLYRLLCNSREICTCNDHIGEHMTCMVKLLSRLHAVVSVVSVEEEAPPPPPP